MGIPDFQKFDTSIRIIHGSCVFIYLFFTKEALVDPAPNNIVVINIKYHEYTILQHFYMLRG